MKESVHLEKMNKNNKILKLKPSARDNRRYLLIDCDSAKQVEEAIMRYIGILGYSKASFMFVKSDKVQGKLIGSCNRKSLIDVKTALLLSNIKVKKVSETIKKLLS